MLCFYRLDPENTKAMDGIQYLERDANSELDMSSIHDLRNRDSMEVLFCMIIFILFIYLFILLTQAYQDLLSHGGSDIH